MKINLYDTTGRWWELAGMVEEATRKLLIHCKTNDKQRDYVKVYPIHENGTYYGGNPIYLLNDHIVAYEVIGQEDDEE